MSLNKHQRGHISELMAAAQYAKEGYEIYWPSFTQSSCDFIATKGSAVERVQVKTPYWVTRTTGAKYYQCTIRKGCGESEYKRYTREDCDVIFIVGDYNYWKFPIEIMGDYKTVCLEKGQVLRRSTKGLNVDEYKFSYD